MSQVTVIEIETRVKDETASGVASAQKNLSKLEQSFLKMQGAFTALSKGSVVEVAATLEDQVSPLLVGISSLGEGLSGTAYQVILEGLDLVSSPLEALRESLSTPFSALVELATVGEVVPSLAEGAGGSGVGETSSTSSLLSQGGASRNESMGVSGGGSESVLEPSVLATSSVLSELVSMFSAVSQVGASSEKEVSAWSETVVQSGVAVGSTVPPLGQVQWASDQVGGSLAPLSSSLVVTDSSLTQTESALRFMETSVKQSEEAVVSFATTIQEKMVGLLASGGSGSGMISLTSTDHSVETSPSTMTQGVLETSTGNGIQTTMGNGIQTTTGNGIQTTMGNGLQTTTGNLLSSTRDHLLQTTTENTAQNSVIGTSQSMVQRNETEVGLVSEGYSSFRDVFSLGSVSSAVFKGTEQNQVALDSGLEQSLLEASVSVDGMCSELFGERISSQLEVFSSTVEESISSSLLLAQDPLSATFQGFFTEHLPSVMEEFFNSQATALEDVGLLAMDVVGEQMGAFWQEDIPALFEAFWGRCGEGLTEGEALALESVTSGVQLFWSEELPSLFEGFWSKAGEHLQEHSATALEEVATGVEGFFGENIPTSLENLWSSSQAKILETSLVTQTIIDLGIGAFFGEVIPSSVQYIWDGASTVLEGAKAASLATVSGGISGFFASTTSAIQGFFAAAQSKMSAAVAAASASLAGLSVATASSSSASTSSSSSSTSTSYGGSSIAAYANGGILSAPHVGLVAEDGPEAIIPLSGKRRSRGLALWEEAGRALGVTPYAQGGLVGSGLKGLESSGEAVVPLSLGETGGDEKQSGSKREGVTVSLGQVNFNVKLDDCRNPEEVLTLFKEKIGECTEEIALSLARSLERSFENMPLYNC